MGVVSLEATIGWRLSILYTIPEFSKREFFGCEQVVNYKGTGNREQEQFPVPVPSGDN
jgi:hypothetical protein